MRCDVSEKTIRYYTMTTRTGKKTHIVKRWDGVTLCGVSPYGVKDALMTIEVTQLTNACKSCSKIYLSNMAIEKVEERLADKE